MATIPTPGTARPNHSAYHGPTRPSISLKIQTSAATLTTSGTMTMNPARKRRRSHWTIAQCRSSQNTVIVARISR